MSCDHKTCLVIARHVSWQDMSCDHKTTPRYLPPRLPSPPCHPPFPSLPSSPLPQSPLARLLSCSRKNSVITRTRIPTSHERICWRSGDMHFACIIPSSFVHSPRALRVWLIMQASFWGAKSFPLLGACLFLRCPSGTQIFVKNLHFWFQAFWVWLFVLWLMLSLIGHSKLPSWLL